MNKTVWKFQDKNGNILTELPVPVGKEVSLKIHDIRMSVDALGEVTVVYVFRLR